MARNRSDKGDAQDTVHAAPSVMQEEEQKTASSKERIAEKGSDTVVVFGCRMPRSNLFRLAGLAAFFVLIAVVLVLVWPMIGRVFTEGPEELVKDVRSAGPLGVLILLGIQFVQIVVAFIPGEVVQIAAGMMYGPWLGALVILVGCVISSFIIYQLVHRLGQPFVEDLVSTKYLEKFRAFEKSGKLTLIVFILFVIPGMPKDVFTYLVPLTTMPLRTYLIVTTVARIPGVVLSTYAADSFLEGRFGVAVAVLVVLAVIAVVGLLFKDRLLAFFQRSKD